MDNLNPITDLQRPSDTDLMAHLYSISEKVAQRPPPDSEPNPSLSQQASKLHPWKKSVRGVPNIVLNTSLFTGSNNRKMLKNSEYSATLDGIEVRFKGERFNQTDLDVWLMLLHLARLQPLGNRIEFTAHSFLKSLDRHTGETQYEQLKEEIVRLRAGTIEITIKGKATFGGGLISKYTRIEQTQKYVVVFDQEILSLYQSKRGFTLINWEQRTALGNNGIAKWLHGFYSTHATPHDLKVETLKRLCGTDTKELYKFRQMLKKALEKLVDVGAIKSWKISWNDLVCVDNKPSLSQQRRINKDKAMVRKSKNQLFQTVEAFFNLRENPAKYGSIGRDS